MKNVTGMMINSLFVALSLLALVGCGTKVGTGAVGVEFKNNTASQFALDLERAGVLGLFDDMDLQDALLGVTPTIFQMKFVVIYIVEDIDTVTGNNKGAGAHVWASKKCDSDLTYCGINPANTNGYTVDYFDFARSTDAVNTDLRNYARDTKDKQIGVGIYNYIRMDFTGKVLDSNDTTPNLKFGTSTAYEVRAQKNAYTIRLPEPLKINEGESFTVSLAYDLQNRFYSSAANQPVPSEVSSSQYWTCNGTGSNVPCIVEAEFSPTIRKN